MRDLYAIRTPENVTFEFELAGVASRAVAWGIDLLAMATLITAASLFVALFGFVLAGFAKALYVVIGFAVQWGYGALFEWHRHGQTVGKRVVGLRVLSSVGTPITFGQAAVRNLLRTIDMLPGAYLVGGVSALCDRRGRRFGDVVADTVVVRTRRSERPAAMVAPSDRYNSFASDPAIAHAARAVTAPERDAMLGLVLRREQLPLVLRHALFARLAAHLERRLSIARPAYFSEERFVLNLTSIALTEDDDAARLQRRDDTSRIRA
ncbi:MAG TPA: RDD family protein [Polyangiales bacterium]